MNDLDKKFACDRLALFLERELGEGRFLTQTETQWLARYRKEKLAR